MAPRGLLALPPFTRLPTRSVPGTDSQVVAFLRLGFIRPMTSADRDHSCGAAPACHRLPSHGDRCCGEILFYYENTDEVKALWLQRAVEDLQANLNGEADENAGT